MTRPAFASRAGAARSRLPAADPRIELATLRRQLQEVEVATEYAVLELQALASIAQNYRRLIAMREEALRRNLVMIGVTG